MSKALTFGELSAANLQRCEECFRKLDEWSPGDWMNTVVGEVGECAHLITDLRLGKDVSLIAVGEEMADTVIYLDLLAQRMGLDLGGTVRRKFNQDSGRFGATQQI